LILGLLLGERAGIWLVLGLLCWVVMGCWLGVGDGIGLVLRQLARHNNTGHQGW